MFELLKNLGPAYVLIAVSIALVILFRVEVWIQSRKTERARTRWIEPKKEDPIPTKQPKQPPDNRKAAKRWTGVDL